MRLAVVPADLLVGKLTFDLPLTVKELFDISNDITASMLLRVVGFHRNLRVFLIFLILFDLIFLMTEFKNS